MNNCSNDRFLQSVCNTPGVSCVYRPRNVRTEFCGNVTAYLETVRISVEPNTPLTNTNLVNIGFTPICTRVPRTQ